MTAENVHMAPEIRPPTVQFQLSWSESVYVKVCRSNTCYADPACYLEPSTYNIIYRSISVLLRYLSANPGYVCHEIHPYGLRQKRSSAIFTLTALVHLYVCNTSRSAFISRRPRDTYQYSVFSKVDNRRTSKVDYNGLRSADMTSISGEYGSKARLVSDIIFVGFKVVTVNI